MTRLLILSDIHTEFHADCGKSFFESFKDADYDVAVIPGDISDNQNLSQSLEYLGDNLKEVVFTKGNHECWGSSIKKTDDLIRNFCNKKSNLHYLEKDSVVINGQRFSGCTLWFKEVPMTAVLGRGWSDFLKIKDFNKDVWDENNKSIKFLNDEVQDDDVVLTHYLTSEKCVSNRFKNDPYNIFFVCPIDDIIWKKQYKLSVHGHTHDSCDTNLGLTRIVCNPFGYVGNQLNPNYIENLIIEV